MTNNKIIRNTQSVCPKCLESIAAQVIRSEKGVFLEKTCPEHGSFRILLSTTPAGYEELERFYFTVIDPAYQVPEYEIWPTYQCNIDCSICCFGRQNQEMADQESPLSALEQFASENKQRFYILSGGEPTCRQDLPEIIKVLKKHRKTVTINTNGIKLKDEDYLQQLKDAGLDRVNLQFDGFDRQAYVRLRRKDYLDVKLRALENLRKGSVQTTFNATIARNLNEGAVLELVRYAVENDFINGINFFTICFLGGARDWPQENYIMPDEIIDLLDRLTENKVKKHNVYIFQKLHMAVKSFLKQKWCFYNQVFLLVRDQGTFQPIDHYLNLRLAEPWLDRYARVFSRHKILSKIYLLIALISLFFKLKSVFVIKEMLWRGFSYFFKTQHYLQGNRFFSASFSTGCDPYKFDRQIVANCQNEIIAAQDNSGALGHIGCDGIYCINLERRHLSKMKKKGKVHS